MPSQKVLEQKKVVVSELSDKIKEAKAFVIADYRGLTVEQDNQLRAAFRKAGVEYRVVKNTLTNFACKQNGYDGLEKFLNGPTSIAISDSDPVSPAKVMSEFAKKFDKLEIKAGMVEGKVIDVNGVNQLADLPSREVLLSQVLYALNGPITGFATALNATIQGLAVALNAVAEKKGQ